VIQRPRASKTIDQISVGDEIRVPYSVSAADVETFAELSGDWNPLHFDDEYAATTIFGRRVAHGMISLAKFSGIFGMDLPGLGTLWQSQSVEFLKPVFLDQPYTAVAKVTNKQRRRVEIDTWVEDAKGDRVITGTAVVVPPRVAIAHTSK
jgi:acyl dehydratase